jgi:8-oxo-dGTP pyrophosphatase MutT (NUDIX family)
MDESNRKLTQVVAGVNIKYIDDVPYVLLGMKSRIDAENIWEFPGGRVNNNESNEAALERRWIEEMGVAIKVDYPRIGHGSIEKYDVWFYEVKLLGDDDEPLCKHHVEIRYFKIDEAMELNTNTINRVMLGKIQNKYTKQT